jgi:hypothetical protein
MCIYLNIAATSNFFPGSLLGHLKSNKIDSLARDPGESVAGEVEKCGGNLVPHLQASHLHRQQQLVEQVLPVRAREVQLRLDDRPLRLEHLLNLRHRVRQPLEPYRRRA